MQNMILCDLCAFCGDTPSAAEPLDIEDVLGKKPQKSQKAQKQNRILCDLCAFCGDTQSEAEPLGIEDVREKSHRSHKKHRGRTGFFVTFVRFVAIPNQRLKP
jgi:hypothetical protein